MHVTLVVVGGKNHGREVPIAKPQFLIGRGEGCQLRPGSDRVSRKHCLILVEEGRVLVRDLKSTNHTYVNKEEVTGDRELRNGDHLDVAGALEFEVQLSVGAAAKKKTKVHTVQEAAVRTVRSSASEELDITEWLENENPNAPTTPVIDPQLKNTRADQALADTTTISQPHKTDEEKSDEKQKSSKLAGQSDKKKKPASENSQEAADNMLKQFFGRKRP
jgi:pSer/pThr/pTyr-binding forkhead associated (FHA) protein